MENGQKTTTDVLLGPENMNLRSKKQISFPLQFHFIQNPNGLKNSCLY